MPMPRTRLLAGSLDRLGAGKSIAVGVRVAASAGQDAVGTSAIRRRRADAAIQGASATLRHSRAMAGLARLEPMNYCGVALPCHELQSIGERVLAKRPRQVWMKTRSVPGKSCLG